MHVGTPEKEKKRKTVKKKSWEDINKEQRRGGNDCAKISGEN